MKLFLDVDSGSMSSLLFDELCVGLACEGPLPGSPMMSEASDG